jgi:hypothetical protein
MRDDGTEQPIQMQVDECSEIVTARDNSDDITNAAVKSILSDAGM